MGVLFCFKCFFSLQCFVFNVLIRFDFFDFVLGEGLAFELHLFAGFCCFFGLFVVHGCFWLLYIAMFFFWLFFDLCGLLLLFWWIFRCSKKGPERPLLEAQRNNTIFGWCKRTPPQKKKTYSRGYKGAGRW